MHSGQFRPGIARESYHGSPEVMADFDEQQEIIEIVRFPDIAACVQLVCLADFFRVCGTRYDNYRCEFQAGMLLNFSENLEAGFLRQVQIEKDKIGLRVLRVFLFAAQVSQSFISVRRRHYCVQHSGFAKGLFGEVNRRRIVFNDQNMKLPPGRPGGAIPFLRHYVLMFVFP